MRRDSKAQRCRAYSACGLMALIVAMTAAPVGAWSPIGAPTLPNQQRGVEVVVVCDSEPWIPVPDYGIVDPRASLPTGILPERDRFPVASPSLPSSYPWPQIRSGPYWDAQLPSYPSALAPGFGAGLPYPASGTQFRSWPSIRRCRPVVIVPGLPG